MKAKDVSNWLRQLYSQEEGDCLPGDDLATTFSACGGVVLASVLSSSISPDRLAKITGLPAPFCGLVVANMDHNDFWSCESFKDVCHAIRVDSDNHNSIKRTLDLFLGDFWNGSKIPYLYEILPALRGRRLMFGRTQDWLDNDLLDNLLGSLAPRRETRCKPERLKVA